MHAAREHGVHAVGVTLSTRQAEWARDAVREAGLADRVEIRVQDYRDIVDGPFDAISSIGMFEHVGVAKLDEYFTRLFSLLRPRVGCSTTASPSGPVAARRVRAPRLHRPLRVPRRRAARGRLGRSRGCSAPGSRCATSKDCASTTRRRCGTGSRTSRRTGTRPCGSSAPGRARVWRLYMAASAMQLRRRAHAHPPGARGPQRRRRHAATCRCRPDWE